MQEFITRYYADHLAEYREMLALSERLVTITEFAEDSPEVGRLAEDFVRHLERTPFPNDPLEGSPLFLEPLGNVFSEILLANFSPTQQRVMERIQKAFEERGGS